VHAPICGIGARRGRLRLGVRVSRPTALWTLARMRVRFLGSCGFLCCFVVESAPAHFDVFWDRVDTDVVPAVAERRNARGGRAVERVEDCAAWRADQLSAPLGDCYGERCGMVETRPLRFTSDKHVRHAS